MSSSSILSKSKKVDATRDLEREAYEFFLDATDDQHKPITVAKHLFGFDATKKMINPTLYKLERLGVIERTKESTDPYWSLSE
jgi:hypothetical protein